MPPAAEVYIQATATDPNVHAQAAIDEAHRRLLRQLTELAEDQAVGAQPDRAHAALIDLCTGELHRLLAAADQTLHAAASGARETRLLVRALRAGAATINAHIKALEAPAATGTERINAAHSLKGMLTVHLAVERTVLLPALAALPGADLPTLVADFTTLLGGGRLEEPPVIDVRTIAHGQRHPRIFTRFSRLTPGQSFTLVNNHDPKPLRREFEATHPGRFTWEYLESGPEQWQVRIGRVADDA